MKKTIDWLRNEIIPAGLLCDEYAERVRGARSKRQLFEICLDANGVGFLPEMSAKGHPLPYPIIAEEFARYLDGRHKPEFSTGLPGGRGYTSAMYLGRGADDPVHIDTTLSCLLGCRCDVHISPFNVARICLDPGCEVTVHCPDTSSVIVECWGGSVPKMAPETRNARVRNMA